MTPCDTATRHCDTPYDVDATRVSGQVSHFACDTLAFPQVRAVRHCVYIGAPPLSHPERPV
jgi:hypothetical protein